jgi:hypothetical protein
MRKQEDRNDWLENDKQNVQIEVQSKTITIQPTRKKIETKLLEWMRQAQAQQWDTLD